MEYYLKSTQNMHVHVKAAILEARKQGYTLKFFRLDNESKSDELTALQSELNFTIEYSAAYCQSQNGVSERNIRSWFKIIRAILRDQKRPRSYWEFAGRCAAFIQNRTYTSACPDAVPAENGTINLFQHVTGEYHYVTYGFTGIKMKGNVICGDSKEKGMIICQLLWKTSEQKECLLDTLKIQDAIFVIAQNEIKFIREGSQVV